MVTFLNSGWRSSSIPSRMSPSLYSRSVPPGHEGYITVGLYKSGQPGELFIQMAKEGSTIGGLMDTVATLTSLTLRSRW
jgi:hypothetical protein